MKYEKAVFKEHIKYRKDKQAMQIYFVKSLQ